MSSEEAISEAEQDFLHRRLCPDGACIGVLDSAGVCKECGLVGADTTTDPRLRGLKRPEATVPDSSEEDAPEEFADEDDEERDDVPEDFENRQLCPDGACIGVIASDGVCAECGAVA